MCDDSFALVQYLEATVIELLQILRINQNNLLSLLNIIITI